MGVTTNSVFHFTWQKSTFSKILLDGGFKMKYCGEEHHLNTGKFEGAVPMVSFCDIPFSKAEEHLDKYGFFGIGLSKDWALKNKLNPVMYVEKFSIFASMLEPYLVDTLNKDKYGGIEKKFHLENLENGKHRVSVIDDKGRAINIDATIALLSFFKNRNGNLIRKKGKLIPNYNFYDEREWRYVPTYDEFESNKLSYTPFLMPKEFQEYSKRPIEQRFLPNLLLKFHSNDIDYLIVKTEKDIPITIKQLRMHKKLYSTEDELNILYTKLVSSKRLLRDV
ncbi:MAG TPA: abortive infection system antitoxin AbiGi family protein [Saprospiraceae bacterium]|nr:abortive infection system antitoxin AbiGi family protein [Saprospiraceae bacterium]